jgi:hypothetical protein
MCCGRSVSQHVFAGTADGNVVVASLADDVDCEEDNLPKAAAASAAAIGKSEVIVHKRGRSIRTVECML